MCGGNSSKLLGMINITLFLLHTNVRGIKVNTMWLIPGYYVNSRSCSLPLSYPEYSCLPQYSVDASRQRRLRAAGIWKIHDWDAGSTWNGHHTSRLKLGIKFKIYFSMSLFSRTPNCVNRMISGIQKRWLGKPLEGTILPRKSNLFEWRDDGWCFSCFTFFHTFGIFWFWINFTIIKVNNNNKNILDFSF